MKFDFRQSDKQRAAAEGSVPADKTAEADTLHCHHPPVGGR